MLLKKDIDPVPDWKNKEQAKNWFYQELARFAGQKTGNEGIISTGTLTTSSGNTTVPRRPKFQLSFHPTNIGGSSGDYFMWIRSFANWNYQLGYLAPFAETPAQYVVVRGTSGDATDNGDGTWNVSNAVLYLGSPSGTTYFALFGVN